MTTNVLRKRGDTYPHKIEVVDKCTNEPIDVTGFSFALAVDPSKTPTDDTNNIMKLIGSISDGPNGRVQFPLTTTDADNVGDYFYDIQMTDLATKPRTIESGAWKMTQDITK